MKMVISAKKIELGDSLKQKIEKKLQKFEKFFKDDAEMIVSLKMEKQRQTVEVTIKSNGIYYRAQETSADFMISLDKVVDVLERQIRKNKTRLAKRLKEGAFVDAGGTGIVHEEEEEGEFIVERTKRFTVKPMSVEEAILQMNLLNHTFFVFKNDDTQIYNIVYKRKDGNYGLIETVD